MLVLSRKENEVITIAGNLIKVTVKKIRGGTVSIAIDAPPEIKIRRGELMERRESSDAA